MSFESPTAFAQQYRRVVENLLQQRGSKLRGSVSEDTYKGKAGKAVEQVGAVNARKRTTRHDDTPLISTPHDARWVFPVDYDWADLIDDQDRIRMVIDPTNPYALNGAHALGRAMDDEVIGAFFGDAKTGENGTTVTAFPASQQIAASGSGLTVAKLREAKKVLMAAEVDIDADLLYVALTAEQHDDMLNEVQATSLDFNTRPVLVDGKISAFMGFNFIHTERLQTDGAAARRCPAWAKSGMHLGMWGEIRPAVSERADKNHATQVYVAGTFGATRLEEKKVVEVLCTET